MSSHKEDDFTTRTDENIAELAKKGDAAASDYLIQKYRNLVKARAHSYFLVGADKEDIVQEGMIGLYKAIRDYEPSRKVTFKAFAELCITRQIITAIKTATRQKHVPLNSYVSFNKPVYADESERTLQDVLTGLRAMNPEELIISRESYEDIEMKMNEVLSELEWQGLIAYLDGKSYREMSVELGRREKSIDNALQRVKRKVEEYLLSRDNRTKRTKSIDR